MFNPFGVAGFNARYYRGFHPRLLSLNPFGIRLTLNAFHHGLNNRGMFMLNPGVLDIIELESFRDSVEAERPPLEFTFILSN